MSIVDSNFLKTTMHLVYGSLLHQFIPTFVHLLGCLLKVLSLHRKFLITNVVWSIQLPLLLCQKLFFFFQIADILGLSPTLFSSLLAIAGLTLALVALLVTIALCICLRERCFPRKVVNSPHPVLSSQSLERKVATTHQNVYMEDDFYQNKME